MQGVLKRDPSTSDLHSVSERLLKFPYMGGNTSEALPRKNEFRQVLQYFTVQKKNNLLWNR